MNQKKIQPSNIPLNKKDPEWEDRVLCVFRAKEYENSLKQAVEYEQLIQNGYKSEIQLNAKDRAIIYYTIVSSCFGILEQRHTYDPDIYQQFFNYLEKYVEICRKAVETSEIREMFTDQPAFLLGKALALLCQYSTSNLSFEIRKWVQAFCDINSPGWGAQLALPVLLKNMFDERRNLNHPNYLVNSKILAEAYLNLTESLPEFQHGRAQVMNLLSDIAYFQRDENAEREALKWAERCLEISPQDHFALAQKKFILERQTVTEQIRRFTHDTNATIAGIVGTMDMILNIPDSIPSNTLEDLRIIRLELSRIQTVNRFVSNQLPCWKEIHPLPPIQELAGKFSSKTRISIVSTEENLELKWDTDIDYLCLAIDNLLINSVEAFERKNIPHSERHIEILLDMAAWKITITDNAGGIEPTIQSRIFEPYVSTKGIQRKTGLGLSNARMAIEDKLEGKLRLAPDQPGNGAKFEIYLKETPDE